MARYLLLWLLLPACSSQPALPADRGAPEARAADLGLEARPAEARVDLRPDGPRPPAVWKTIAPAPELERHALAPLPGGDVLVVGGASQESGSYVALAAAHRFLYAAGSFADAGKLAQARRGHTATALADGRVLVAGGEDANILGSAELFDPAKPAGSAWSATPAMLAPTSEHQAVRLQSGQVLLAGGRAGSGDSLNTLQLYDPASGSWKLNADPLKQSRRCHTLTLLKNGKVLIAGGVKGSGWETVWLQSLEVYDPATGTTKLLAGSMHMGRCGHTASLLLDGRVLIAGGFCGSGSSCPKPFVDDLYDPAKDQVTPVVHPGDFPSSHVAAALLDGRVLVAGGGLGGATASAFLYDPAQSAWISAPPLAEKRFLGRAELLPDGSVLVVGGLVSETPYLRANTAERFFP